MVKENDINIIYFSISFGSAAGRYRKFQRLNCSSIFFTMVVLPAPEGAEKITSLPLIAIVH